MFSKSSLNNSTSVTHNSGAQFLNSFVNDADYMLEIALRFLWITKEALQKCIILHKKTETWLAIYIICILFVIKLLLYFCNARIAIFFLSNTFSKVQANSNQIWKFQRYQLILEYAHRPVLVPPFIIFNHLYLMYKACCRPRCCNKKNNLHRKRKDKKLSECK